jgi:hypothetical protein
VPEDPTRIGNPQLDWRIYFSNVLKNWSNYSAQICIDKHKWLFVKKNTAETLSRGSEQ